MAHALRAREFSFDGASLLQSLTGSAAWPESMLVSPVSDQSSDRTIEVATFDGKSVSVAADRVDVNMVTVQTDPTGKAQELLVPTVTFVGRRLDGKTSTGYVGLGLVQNPVSKEWTLRGTVGDGEEAYHVISVGAGRSLLVERDPAAPVPMMHSIPAGVDASEMDMAAPAPSPRRRSLISTAGALGARHRLSRRCIHRRST